MSGPTGDLREPTIARRGRPRTTPGRRRETGLLGHEYAIDAALAVIAGRQPAGVVLFTSDEDDMGKLCGPGVRVVPL
ncbi:hypothetical protein [Streptomyces massasporeus]|uniref:hypothetical protein n=1 Tax=Streptomyces massasporeus TaxID=67324 RepID=UPI003809074E